MTREQDPVLERVKQQLGNEPGVFERLEDRRASKARRKRATAGVVGLGVAAALIGGLVWSTSRADGSGDDVVTPGSNVPLVAGPGEYYYVRTAGYGQNDAGQGLDRGYVSEVWAGTDDSGRVSSPYGQRSDETFAAGEFPGTFLPELSDDPETLLQQLIERGSEGGASPNVIATTSPGRSQETTSLLRTLEDMLSLGGGVFLTPQQTATVFQAASTIDDVTTEPGVTDPLGRAATKLSYVIDYDYPGNPAQVMEWYFDPQTGQMLAAISVDAETGETQGGTIIEMAGIAASVDDIPSPDARYVKPGTTEPSFLGSGGSAGQVTPSPEAA